MLQIGSRSFHCDYDGRDCHGNERGLRAIRCSLSKVAVIEPIGEFVRSPRATVTGWMGTVRRLDISKFKYLIASRPPRAGLVAGVIGRDVGEEGYRRARFFSFSNRASARLRAAPCSTMGCG